MTSPNEQQRVDVLAVMEDAYRLLYLNAPDERAECEARDACDALMAAKKAVAELIDKASALRSAHEAFQAWKKSAPKDASVPRSILEMNVHAKAMLFAALANVGAQS